MITFRAVLVSAVLSASAAAQGLTILTSTLPAATVGSAYAAALSATGGTPPYKWAAGQGFPAFFTLNTTTGAITGTPTAAGVFTFPVQVTDAAGATSTSTFTLTTNTASLAITTIPPLFNGIVGSPYVQTFSATGGVPPYIWTISAGAVPGGLTLDPNTGTLQGTPQSTGTSTFTVQVTDKTGTVVSQAYSITITAPVLTVIVGGTLPSGAVNVGYSQKLPVTANGGTAPYTWSLVNGSVPGLSFDPVNIALTGTPTTAGTFSLTVQVTDSAGLTATKTLSLTIAPAGLGISSARQLPNTPFNTAFSATLTAAGGTPPYTWSANGLPAGLSINASSGVISGVPNAAGAFSFAVTVTDSTLAQYSDRFSINVTLPSTPPVSLSGLSGTLGPLQQMPLQITLGSSFPVAITGQAVLTFTPDSGPADRTIQFASGGTTASFSIPAGSTAAVSSVPLAIQTGTVSGTITVTLQLLAGVTDITPSPAPTVTAQIARAAPVISNVQVTRSGSTLSAVITGYATSREVTQMTFNFTAASGQTLQSSASSITVAVDTLFATWYQDPVNGQYGSQFVFTQPFTVQGDPTLVTLASLVLTNRAGSTTTVVNK